MYHLFLKKHYLYIKVYRNRIDIRDVGDEKRSLSLTPARSFTTERLLVGEFSIAAKLLKNGFKQMNKSVILAYRPFVVIQPMDMIENKISEVEERMLMELALGAGAYKAVVWTGRELTDKEVVEKLAITGDR